MSGRAPIGVAATALALVAIARYRRDVRRGGHALTQLDAGAQRAVAGFMGAAERPVAQNAPVLAEGG